LDHTDAFRERYTSVKERRPAPNPQPRHAESQVVRALGRVGWLLPAITVPVCVAALGVGIQAPAFQRPPGDALVATDALRELLRYRVMRATEVVRSHELHSICGQGWYHRAHHRRLVPGALVWLSNGVKLYDVANGVHDIGLD